MVQSRGTGNAGARVPRTQALVLALAVRTAADRQDRARAQDGLDQDEEADS